jgi:O-methyltransferase
MNIKAAIKIAQPYTKCAYERLFVTASQLERIDKEGIDGDVVECGVWRGGIVILARLLSPHRKVWLYDTFNGMAGRSKHDIKPGGYMMPEGKAAVSSIDVIANLVKTGTMQGEFICVVEGRVEDTLKIDTNLPDKIGLLHLDTDWYFSTKAELEILWPRLQRRGALIVDDYGHWKGAKKAFDDYFPPLQRNYAVIDKSAIFMVKP